MPPLPIPGWAWAFAVVCFAIPVVAIGGAVPTGLGVGGGVACLQIARKPGQSVRQRALRAAAVSGGCWAAFILLAVVVFAAGAHATSNATSKSKSSKSTPDISEEAVRREVFGKATWMIQKLEEADQRLAEDRAEGKSTKFAEKRVKHLEGMHEHRLESIATRYQLTRKELETILAEGFEKEWLVDP